MLYLDGLFRKQAESPSLEALRNYLNKHLPEMMLFLVLQSSFLTQPVCTRQVQKMPSCLCATINCSETHTKLLLSTAQPFIWISLHFLTQEPCHDSVMKRTAVLDKFTRKNIFASVSSNRIGWHMKTVARNISSRAVSQSYQLQLKPVSVRIKQKP